MVDHHHPVQTSAVFLLGAGAAQRSLIPPPSPPSGPLTPNNTVPASPIEELCLDGPSCLPEPAPEEDPLFKQRLASALHVLNTEATALRSLTHLYESDPVTAAGFSAAIGAITRSQGEKGKVVIIGVGKSGHIGKKLVASFISLGVHATYLHPTEALHGDLGKIGPHDTVLFITFSGKTPELLLLLPHIDPALPTIILTSHTRPDTCALIQQRPDMILVPTPIHEPETVSFGVSAPTTSTTMTIAIGDALAITASNELYNSVSSVFSRNHPGGAIGASFRKPQKLKDLATPICDIAVSPRFSHEMTGADVLKAGYDSPTGWVQLKDIIASPSRIRRLDGPDLMKPLSEIPWSGTRREEWITLSGNTRISQAVEWIRDMQCSPEEPCDEYSILAVMEQGDVVGVLEAGQLLSWEA